MQSDHNSHPDRLALLPKDDAERLRRKYERARGILYAASVKAESA